MARQQQITNKTITSLLLTLPPYRGYQSFIYATKYIIVFSGKRNFKILFRGRRPWNLLSHM